MMHNPLTKASLKMLKLCNFRIIETTTKELACKDIGDGAMADVENIFHTSCQELLQDKYWKDRKVVLNGGGTIEKIDDIRYLSNFSSGKMANSLATALYYKGADVCLVTTKHTENIPSEIHTIKVQSATEMLDFVNDAISIAKKGKLSSATLMDNSNIELIRKTPFFFGVAAVSDYTPKFPQNGKIKKDDIGDNWELSLKKNTDILSSIKKDEIITIGFKAEMDKSKAKENAQNMLVSKNIDAVCLNILDDKNNFGSDKNSIELFTQNSTKTNSWNNLDKLTLSLNILNQLAQEFHD
jgi:phosphopantothenoylcysteine decarboxylase/phosphopantothenate--cysteine ligase